MPQDSGYVSADYLRKATQITAQFKQRSYQMMNVTAESIVADIGCGPGIDTTALAELAAQQANVATRIHHHLASAEVDYPNSDLERRLLNFFARTMRPNGFAGRQLLSLVSNTNMLDIQLEVIPLQIRLFSETPFGPWLCYAALEANITSQEALHHWLEFLQQRSDQGHFYCSLNMVLVAATKA